MPTLPDPLGGRAIEEWVGSSPDARIPQRVQDRIWLRYKGRCYLSGRKIMPGDKWELEHIRALSMGGEHRERNLAPALKEVHKAKTADEAKARSKADRMRRKANGTWPKSKTPLKSRGFSSTRLWTANSNPELRESSE